MPSRHMTRCQRTTEAELAKLQADIRAICEKNGPSARQIDIELAAYLYDSLEIKAHEAFQAGIWSFLTTVLLPDVVGIRFGSNRPISIDRFLVGPFGGRNTLGRLWWRTRLLQTGGPDPLALLRALGEDQIVQVMERPFLMGYPPLAATTAGAWVRHQAGRNSELLMRKAVKRLRRMGRFLSFEAMTPKELEDTVEGVFDTTATTIESHSRRGWRKLVPRG